MRRCWRRQYRFMSLIWSYFLERRGIMRMLDIHPSLPVGPLSFPKTKLNSLLQSTE
jgi:hypothetical protein